MRRRLLMRIWGCGVWLLGLGVTAGAQPRQLALLDVPFQSQTELLCGGAAAAMVLRYWGEREIAAESFAHLVDRSAAGIRTTALIDELRRLGWSAFGISGSREDLEHELARGRPVLALIEDRPGTYHYVVIVGSVDRAVIFHDPARAPFRVMSRAEFERRWLAADRWMAVVVPGGSAGESAASAGARLAVRPSMRGDARSPAHDPSVPGDAQSSARGGAPSLTTPAFAPGDTPSFSPDAGAGLQSRPPGLGDPSCDDLIAEGIRLAQDNDLDASERVLTAALSCPGPAALRELAGVRLLQGRWSEVSDLAAAALAEDPADEHAVRLLATSRFIQNDAPGALELWNRVGEPTVDLVSIDGLARTRHRSVETMLGISRGELLTPSRLLRASRRLSEVPAFLSARLEYVPVGQGRAEIRARVMERPLVPAGRWSYAALGLTAAARREADASVASPGGGGERFDLSWRFWPGRPRVGMTLSVPRRGGVWSASAFVERQPFAGEPLEPAARRAVSVGVGGWLLSTLRVHADAGVERRRGAAWGRGGLSVQWTPPGARLSAYAEAHRWMGSSAFSTLFASLLARTSAERRGPVALGRVGAALATSNTPLDLWWAGDTGHARPLLLRAHPVLSGGALRADRLGRTALAATVEGQYWWSLPWGLRAGGAAFIDAARVGRRRDGPAQ
ncbi:MAG TPA: C39 family peptidase, partial [Vicinamibacterales bacterium]|nr:C39 family peptidase [Vicinamibacterales bacterium]